MEAGDQFGPYRVLGVLGRGGMGEVLRAHDAEHERDVALKVLHPQWASDEGYRERFRREARVAARLREPHVVPIHRYGEIDGRLFLDMRLVEGEDLAALLRRTGPLDPGRAVDVVGQVARALDAAHADGLVHRDVKPSNVLLVGRADGGDLAASAVGEDFVYLVDFGIARTLDSGTGPPLTGTGLTIGSTEYMAPERFLGTPLSAATDVYSLACVLYEALTGRRPFPPGDAAAQMYAHLNSEPPPPSAERPEVPAVLDAVVLRGLAKDPAQRWTSAGGMAAAARAALAVSGVEVPRPPSEPYAALPDGATTVGTVGTVDPEVSDRATTRQRPIPAATSVQGVPAGQGVPPSSAVPPPVPGASGVGASRAGSSAVPAGDPGGDPGAGRGPLRAAVATAAVAALAAVGLAAWLVVTDGRADRATGDAEDAATRLLGLSLPVEVTLGDCSAAEPSGGALQQVSCPRSEETNGPTSSSYQVFPGSGAADAAQADIDRLDLGRLETASDCGFDEDGQGWIELRDTDDRPVGRLLCYTDPADGDAVLSWTWDDLGSRAVVQQRGQGPAGVGALRSWWGTTADRT